MNLRRFQTATCGTNRGGPPRVGLSGRSEGVLRGGCKWPSTEDSSARLLCAAQEPGGDHAWPSCIGKRAAGVATRLLPTQITVHTRFVPTRAAAGGLADATVTVQGAGADELAGVVCMIVIATRLASIAPSVVMLEDVTWCPHRCRRWPAFKCGCHAPSSDLHLSSSLFTSRLDLACLHESATRSEAAPAPEVF